MTPDPSLVERLRWVSPRTLARSTGRNLQDPENKSIVRCEIANCAATTRKLPIEPQYGESAHVAVDAKGVYWANYDTVLRADHDGANTTVIAASLNGVVGLAATGCVLYVAQAGGEP